MAKDPGVVQTAIRPRTNFKGGAAARGGAPTVDDKPAKKPFNPVQFATEVRAEARKITWTTWKETWITSVMVGIMVVITAVFFFGVDGILSFLVTQFLKLATGGQ
ncbi:MAG: preprotein translocase subunit SecE [Caulobacteraceae bacterium]